MRTLFGWTMAAMIALCGISLTQSAEKNASNSSAKEKLIGTWHLVSMEEPTADGSLRHFASRASVLPYNGTPAFRRL